MLGRYPLYVSRLMNTAPVVPIEAPVAAAVATVEGPEEAQSGSTPLAL
ncbi:MAG: hypothetical protein WDO73_02905 [Ignavibacteriota bacterium]